MKALWKKLVTAIGITAMLFVGGIAAAAPANAIGPGGTVCNVAGRGIIYATSVTGASVGVFAGQCKGGLRYLTPKDAVTYRVTGATNTTVPSSLRLYLLDYKTYYVSYA